MKSIKILGVRFDKISLEQAINRVKEFLSLKKQSLIFTPNPEMCVEAKKNSYFKEVLNYSDLNLCDGFGVFLVSRFFKNLKLERITGVDFFLEICGRIEAKIFLLGAEPGVAQKCKLKLESKFPKISVVGTLAGSLDKEGLEEIEEEINKTKPEILFVAFGAPKQEIFLFENLHKFPSVKVGIGVGGTFDFVSQAKKRAPAFVRKLGLEWLFRLFLEPKKRFFRIWNATFRFLFLVFGEIILKSFKK